MAERPQFRKDKSLASYKKRETLPRRVVLGSLLVAAILVWVYRKYSLDLQDLVSYLLVSLGLLGVIVALAALPIWIRKSIVKSSSQNAEHKKTQTHEEAP